MSIASNNTLEGELTKLLNRYGADSLANTPDWLLAKFLMGNLTLFNKIMAERDQLSHVGKSIPLRVALELAKEEVRNAGH